MSPIRPGFDEPGFGMGVIPRLVCSLPVQGVV